MFLHPQLPRTTLLDPEALLGQDLTPSGCSWSLYRKWGGIFPCGTIASGEVSLASCLESLNWRDSPQEENSFPEGMLPGSSEFATSGGIFSPQEETFFTCEGCPGGEQLELAKAWERILFPSEGASPQETAAHRNFSWVGELSFCCALLSLSCLCCTVVLERWFTGRTRASVL